MDEKLRLKSASLFDWVKAIVVLTFVGVVAYKILITPIDLTIDFPTLLSLLLALFSVGLAALFYFKATETSNTFYDNSYNFTKDIAQLLVKIESGFGERLRHLDEGYSSMRDQIQRLPAGKTDQELAEAKKKIEDEKRELKRTVEERDKIVGELIEHSQLKEEEKENVTRQLREKEEEVEQAQHQLERMNHRFKIERMRRLKSRSSRGDTSLRHYTKNRVIDELGAAFLNESPLGMIRAVFDDKLSDKLPRGYIDDLERFGYFEDGLTDKGAALLSELAAEDSDV